MNANLISPKSQRNCLLFSFRYALGSMSMAPVIMVEIIEESWPDIKECDRELIKREIRQAIDQGLAGMDCDVKTWERILEL